MFSWPSLVTTGRVTETGHSHTPLFHGFKALCAGKLAHHGRIWGTDKTTAPLQGWGAGRLKAAPTPAIPCSLQEDSSEKDRVMAYGQGSDLLWAATAAVSLGCSCPPRTSPHLTWTEGQPTNQQLQQHPSRLFLLSYRNPVLPSKLAETWSQPVQLWGTELPETEYAKRLKIARETFLKHQIVALWKKLTGGTRSQLDSERIQACLKDDTNVLLAPKLGHFLDTVNSKHYCHLFRTWNCIKCYV